MTLLTWAFVRFISVGALCAIVDTTIVWVLAEEGVQQTFALTIGFAVGFILNYILHARFTFGIEQMHLSQLLRFIAVVIANYFITIIVVFALHNLLGFGLVLAKVASLPVVAVNGYFLSKLWVFDKSVKERGGKK